MNIIVIREYTKTDYSYHNLYMDIDILIGKNLKRLRQERGLSQEKLAELIGTPATRLSAYEHGREGMGKNIMARICAVLNVRPYEFFLENNSLAPATELEKKALYMARVAEKMGVSYIAEEMVAYTTHRIDEIKKHKKEGNV